jgi:pimeloyl-ACP methyl ester carboxylesterase
VFFTPLNYRVPEKELQTERKAARFSLKVNHKTIACYSWGKGPVVVVLHGWAGRATQFRKFIEVLTRRGYCVIGFDGPAHGRSEGKSTNIHEFEDVLKQITAKVGVPEAYIAHSFGGSAVLFAVMNGLAVKKIINIASPTIGDEIIRTYLKAIGGSWKTGEYFKSLIRQKSGKTFDEFTSLYFVRHIKPDLDLLLVHDESDDQVPIDHANALVKAYPYAKLYRTSGLGHTRILKDEAVIHKCVTFIEELRLTE